MTADERKKQAMAGKFGGQKTLQANKKGPPEMTSQNKAGCCRS